jgi:hypothetical protein
MPKATQLVGDRQINLTVRRVNVGPTGCLAVMGRVSYRLPCQASPLRRFGLLIAVLNKAE